MDELQDGRHAHKRSVENLLSVLSTSALANTLTQETGGTDGILDEGLLDSALAAPFQSIADIDVFPSIQQRAARLGYSLVKNHAFIDGNKRIEAHVMLVFLALNKIALDYTQAELSSGVSRASTPEWTSHNASASAAHVSRNTDRRSRRSWGNRDSSTGFSVFLALAAACFLGIKKAAEGLLP